MSLSMTQCAHVIHLADNWGLYVVAELLFYAMATELAIESLDMLMRRGHMSSRT